MTRRFVVDASIVVDLVGRFRPEPIERLVWAADAALAAPELLDLEALHALRRLDREGRIPPGRTDLVEQVRALPIRRYRHDGMLEDIWSLRGHLTAYDAAYVALTRRLDATLITRDERLARASGLGKRVVLP